MELHTRNRAPLILRMNLSPSMSIKSAASCRNIPEKYSPHTLTLLFILSTLIMKFTSSIALLFISSLSLVFAAPVRVEFRSVQDVYVPLVTEPEAGDVWIIGETQTVTWDVSNPPINITNSVGTIRLRKGDLTTPLILADNFSILLGEIEVVVPNVVEGDDYKIVLFGDSGNFSPAFTITN